ncbi:Glycosyltransferase-like 1B [Sparganum proliferum]
MRGGDCGRDPCDRTTENPWKIRGFEWELTSKGDDRQEVEPLEGDHRPTRKRNDHTRVLFQSWRIEGLTTHIYNMGPYLKEVDWIPTVHYSGIYGLAKLLVPEIIPAHIQRIIFLDLDLVITCNLKGLWKYFGDFSNDEMIGLIENQSDWYIQARTPARWPAVGRGFNTGVVLMDIHKMRRNAWGSHWRNVTENILQKLSYTSLADQDIVNAALFYDSRRVRRLPCKWNVQLTDSADYANCLGTNDVDVNYRDSFFERACILHWNKPSKPADAPFSDHNSELQKAKEPDLSGARINPSQNPQTFRRYFEKLQAFFAEYDGNLFRKKDCSLYPGAGCIPSAENYDSVQPNGFRTRSSKISHHDCLHLREEMKLRRRIHPYFFGKFNESQRADKESSLTSSEPGKDVTLVSQLTIDRLHRLEEIVAHWDGPISLALYVTDKEVLLLMEYIQSVPILNSRQDLCIHIIFREGNFYPINGLRNIAVHYATTDYVFLVDFDFIPTPRMHTYLRDIVSSQMSKVDDSEDDNLIARDNNMEVKKPSVKRSSSDNDSRPVAYVIPAFETFYTQFLFPSNKTELLNQINIGVVKPFRIDLWPAGHQATNYTHWYNSSIPYEVKWEADFEPYVVVKKSAAKFDTRFLGFGWNKVAYTMLLDALGYRFVVLPEVFVIHLPHSPSMDVYRFRNSPLFRRCLERFKVEFIKELAHIYGVRSLKYLQFRQRPNGI